MARLDEQMMRGMFGLPMEPTPQELPELSPEASSLFATAVAEESQLPQPALPPEMATLGQGFGPENDGVSIGAGSLSRPKLPQEMANLGREPQRTVEDVNADGLDGSRERLRAAYEAQKAANQATFEAEARARAFESERGAAMADLAQEDEALRQEMDASARQSASLFRADLEKQMGDAARAPDSTRFWHNRGGVHKAAGFITAFLGAFQGPEMQQNVNAIIDQAVRRDIEDQRAEIAADQQEVSNFKELRQLELQDEQFDRRSFEREALVRKAVLAAELEKRAASLGEGVAKANLQNAAAAAQAGLADDLNNLEGVEYNREFQSKQADRQYQIQRGQLGVARGNLALRKHQAQEAQRQREEERLRQQPPAIPPEAVVDPDTRQVIGIHRQGKQEAVKLQGDVAAYRDFRAKLEAYEHAYKRIGRVYKGLGSSKRGLASQDAAELKQLHTALASAATKASSGAGASEDEFKRQFAVIPEPPSVTKGVDIAPRIKTYQSWQDDSLNRKLAGSLVDETGQIVDFDVRDLYAPVDGQGDSTTEAELGRVTQAAVADAPKRVGWIRGTGNEGSTERYNAVHELFVRAKKGDLNAEETLQDIASKKLPTSSEASSLLGELGRHREAVAANPRVVATDSQGAPIAEEILTESGELRGMRHFSKGELTYESEYFPGTQKEKSRTLYKGGKPSLRFSYDESGGFLGKEKL